MRTGPDCSGQATKETFCWHMSQNTKVFCQETPERKGKRKLFLEFINLKKLKLKGETQNTLLDYLQYICHITMNLV